MAQLPGAPDTLAYDFVADATTAVRIALEDNCTSITVQVPTDATWCAIAFGDNAVVATKAGGRTGSIGGYPIDEARPSSATHVSVIAGAAAELVVIQRRP